MNEYFIAWWNLENLFNVEDWPDRPQRLKDVLKRELKGWSEEILAGKISQLSKKIIKLNNGLGPDLLGVCEVEDGPVVGKLADSLKTQLNRDYQIVHERVDDKRGIEVAFIYDSTKFEIAKSTTTGEDEVFSHHVLRSEATRNILQVNFKLKSSGRYLVLIGNHWPSRTRGELESEAFRIVAGEALGYFHKRILEELGKDTAILAMGDFNDQPFNRSVMDQGLGTAYEKQVDQAHAESPFFYNLMWRLMADGLATFYYTPWSPFGGGGNNNGGQTTYPNMLDQFMVSRAVKFGSQIKVKAKSVTILKDDMHDNSPFQRPVKYGRPSTHEGVNRDGFSDHFPISLILQEE